VGNDSAGRTSPELSIPKTPAAYVKGFISACPVNTHIGIDANNEAPHTLISEAFYRQFLEPMGEVLETIRNGDMPKLIGAGCDEIVPLGIIRELDVTFGSKRRISPHINITALILKGNFSCDVLFNVDTIRKLGMVIDYSSPEPFITLNKLNPIIHVELGQAPMGSVAETNSTSGTLPHGRQVTSVPTIFDLKTDHIVPPHTMHDRPMCIAATIQNVEEDYSFTPSHTFSAILPGFFPKETNQTTLLAINPTDDPIILERALEVNANVSPTSNLAQNSEPSSKEQGTGPLSSGRRIFTPLAVLAVTSILACCNTLVFQDESHTAIGKYTAKRLISSITEDPLTLSQDELDHLNIELKDHRTELLQQDQGDYLDIPCYMEPGEIKADDFLTQLSINICQ
jgi:hypothetical protein